MKRILVWDLPIRLFHWLMALGFVVAFVIASTVRHGDAAFATHMLIGLTMGLMVLLRLVWGFVGSRYARFSTFAFGPRAVLGYLKAALGGRGDRHVGHNPGSSVAIWGILGSTIALIVTGLLKVTGTRAAGDIHEVFAYLFLAAVIAHVLGLLLHTVRHRENIALSMISGKKDAEPDAAIVGSRPIVAVVFLILVGLWGWRLAANYDGATRRLIVPVVGAEVQLGRVRGAAPPTGAPEVRDHED